MKDFEIFLKKAIGLKNENNSIDSMPIELFERNIVNELERLGLITNVRYIALIGVGFDLTVKGVNYFD